MPAVSAMSLHKYNRAMTIPRCVSMSAAQQVGGSGAGFERSADSSCLYALQDVKCLLYVRLALCASVRPDRAYTHQLWKRGGLVQLGHVSKPYAPVDPQAMEFETARSWD